VGLSLLARGFEGFAESTVAALRSTVWMTVLACITLKPFAVEFAYFVGLAAAGMSVLTPDLWSPWPTYPSIYFFVGHGGIVIAVVMLVFGKIAVPRPGAVWRVFGLLVLYAVAIVAVNMFYDANYMYFCRRPANPSLLDLMGPWPIYILAAAPLSLALFCLLWLPIREKVYEIPEGNGEQGVGSREPGVGSAV
jgi:hypothetical integral membrane protein (TIGR02206 family)